MISMRFRRLSRRLFYLAGRKQDFRPGMQGLPPLFERIPEPLGAIISVGQHPRC